MGFKHFGILTNKKILSFNLEQFFQFLKKENIINSKVHGTIKENKLLNEKGGFEKIIQFHTTDTHNDYTDKFLGIIYLFLKNYMNELIKVNTMLFNQNFKNKTLRFARCIECKLPFC